MSILLDSVSVMVFYRLSNSNAITDKPKTMCACHRSDSTDQCDIFSTGCLWVCVAHAQKCSSIILRRFESTSGARSLTLRSGGRIHVVSCVIFVRHWSKTVGGGATSEDNLPIYEMTLLVECVVLEIVSISRDFMK